MYQRIPLFLLILILLSSISFAQLNPKSISNIELKITKSGEVDIMGSVSKLNLSLYIPQEDIKEISIYPNNWEYKQDKFGNKQVVLKWDNPTGKIQYQVDMIVENSAKHLLQDTSIGTDPSYLKETDSVIFSDSIRKLAYPYEKTLDRVAELAIYVNDIVEYDRSLGGERKSSEWVLQNKRGVCVEYVNLLAALLRVSDIPTRYVVGYAYSTVDNDFTGHSWLEVLVTDASGIHWVPFDPTWLQGGYLDATHIKTANLLDDNQTETLYYVGRGTANWIKDKDNIEIISYTTSNITQISLFSEEFPKNGAGYLKASISSNECTISHITASSCIDENRNHMFNIRDNEREVWFCDAATIYWIFDITESSDAFSCPVLVYDQIGSEETERIIASTEKQIEEVFITGPDSIGINEPFTLEAVTDEGFIFFSPTLGSSRRKTWDLSIDKPGSYNFYLYSENSIAEKTIQVAEKQEFSLSVEAPTSIELGSFLVNVTAESLLDEDLQASVRVEFNENIEERIFTLPAKQTKTLVFNITAEKPGTSKLSTSIMSESITSYSTTIEVKKPTTSIDILDSIISFFSSIIESITSLLG